MENHIEIRCVEVRQADGSGGFFTKGYRFQYRTKDITASLLNVIPLSSSWSPWTDMQTATVVLQDENGNPSA